jgi:hypothetical protein
MALALADTGEFAYAEELYGRALCVMENAPGGEPEQAITHLNLADLYALENANAKIGAQLETARSLLEKCASSSDANYAFVCSKCAPVFAHYGMAEYAKTLEERSRRIYEGA